MNSHIQITHLSSDCERLEKGTCFQWVRSRVGICEEETAVLLGFTISSKGEKPQIAAVLSSVSGESDFANRNKR